MSNLDHAGTGRTHHLRPRRSITRYTPGHYSETTAAAPTTMPASAAGSQHTTRSATGSRTGGQITNQAKAEQDSVSDEDDDGENHGGAGSKLEQRRERNRIKQRNLRKRRVDYTQGLEDQIKALRSEVNQSRQSITILSNNEPNYKQWIQDLEAALFRQGHGSEVDSLRRAWTRSITPLPIRLKAGAGTGSGGRKGKGRMPTQMTQTTQRPECGVGGMAVNHARPIDPLSTLVQAAMVSDQSLVAPGSYSTHSPIPAGHSHHPSESSTTFHPPLPSISPSFAFPFAHSNNDRIPTPIPSRTPQVPIPRHPSGSVSHNPSRRPSTSYNPPSSWESQYPSHAGGTDDLPQLKRKRSVSGPIIQNSQSLRDPLPPLKSLSEPASARHPFQMGQSSSSAITLPPIRSLSTTPSEHHQHRQNRQEQQRYDERNERREHHRQHHHQQQQQHGQQTQAQAQVPQASGFPHIGVGRHQGLGITLPPLLPVPVPGPSTSAPNTPPMMLPPSMESRDTSPSSTSLAKSMSMSMSIDHLLTPRASGSEDIRE